MATSFDTKGVRNNTSRRSRVVPISELQKREEFQSSISNEESPTGFLFSAESFRRNKEGEVKSRELKNYFLPTTNPVEAKHELDISGVKILSMKPRRMFRKNRARIPTRVELAQLAEQIGDLWEAGEPPVSIFTMLGKNHTNPLISQSLQIIAGQITQGRTIAQAFELQRTVNGRTLLTPEEMANQEMLSRSRGVFPSPMIHALKISEESGAFTDSVTGKSYSAMYAMMHRFAVDQTKADNIFNQIKSAFRYPVGVGLFTIVAVGIMMYFVVPKLKELYESLVPNNSDLPLPTRILVATSSFMVSWPGLALLVVFIVLLILLYRFYKSPKGNEWFARRYIYWPKLGDYLCDYYAVESLRNCAMLNEGNSDLKATLREAAHASSNPEYKDMFLDVLYQFENTGKDLYEIWRPYARLMGPGFHTTLLTFAKKGDMTSLFMSYAEVLETRVDRQVKSLTDFVETYAILPVAVIVGGIVISFYLPLFDILGKINK